MMHPNMRVNGHNYEEFISGSLFLIPVGYMTGSTVFQDIRPWTERASKSVNELIKDL